ncbi:MAG TPA: AAA family ATPase [Acidimicrobiia bacterium]|jgi:ATP-dependent Zn protease
MPVSTVVSALPAQLLDRSLADVARLRERARRRRCYELSALLWPLAVWLWWRQLRGDPVTFGWVRLPPSVVPYLPQLVLIVVLIAVFILPMALAGRSPHIRLRPEEIEVGFGDIVGMDVVREEVIRTVNLFLAFKTFRERMGGTPRRGVLFEGPPGTGKTHMAKAMAGEAGVPFLFVSSSAFQSMYYGQTNRKIRSYFRALRKAARREGGAIGFIEEIDAIAGARSGMRATPLAAAVHRSGVREGISGIVNELLVQLQSFDQPSGWHRFVGAGVDVINRFLPDHRRLRKRPSVPANILVVGATNRASDLDPALMRPGRFDRSIHFDLPSRTGRRALIDYFLAKKAHESELDENSRREALAAMTAGYTPVMIEHLFDEGLVWALRDGKEAMGWADVQQAKFTEEMGLKQPVEYTTLERARIATHEAGHAVMAHLVGTDRKLEVLSIIKRGDALGLLAHSDAEERFTRTRSELSALVEIALGGMVAEELFFGESSTGPGGDLATATRLAAQMVGAFGMAGSLVSFEAVESGPLAVGIVGKVLSFDAGRQGVEDLLAEAKSRTRTRLEVGSHLVEALRDALLAREELVGDEITEVLRTAEVVDVREAKDVGIRRSRALRPPSGTAQPGLRSSLDAASKRHGNGPGPALRE